MQHVIGCDPRIPGLLTEENVNHAINSGVLTGERTIEKSNQIRQAARKAYIDAENDSAVRKAINHRTRPERGPFNTGEKVYFWRKAKDNKGSRWHGPATVIGKNDNQSKIWITYGNKVLRCSPEQLRQSTWSEHMATELVPDELKDVHMKLNKAPQPSLTSLTKE
jgi:hypothetical protein